MQSLWNEQEAAPFQGDLGLRVYTSRLLGRDKSLVLHGGGNTSVKVRARNLVGDEEHLLYVKGSGWDLEFIEEAGFSPVRMAHLLKLGRIVGLQRKQPRLECLANFMEPALIGFGETGKLLRKRIDLCMLQPRHGPQLLGQLSCKAANRLGHFRTIAPRLLQHFSADLTGHVIG